MKTITLNIFSADGAKVATVTGVYEYAQDEAPLLYVGNTEILIPFMLGLGKLPETMDGQCLQSGWKFLEQHGFKTEVEETGEWEYLLPDAE